MARVVIVLPSIVPHFTQACLASLHPDIIDPVNLPQPPTQPQRDPMINIRNGAQWTDGKPDVRLVVVWNTPEHNLGVAGSWNIGRDELLRTEGPGWLVIVSAAVRFGREGGRDFLRFLTDQTWWASMRVTHPHPTHYPLGVEADGGLGWHLLAFPANVLAFVGPFDTEYHPAYGEDLDYSRRIQLAYGIDSTAPDFVGPLWPKVKVDATLTKVAHGIKHGHVPIDFGAIEALHIRKWGAKSPDEYFATPYNDPSLDHTFTGPYSIRALA